MQIIKNANLTVSISETGAEMHSVVHNGLERLWCADPAVWNKHAPLLFPLIGRLRQGQYLLNGQPVDAPRHGFCRERAFEVVDANEASVAFRTTEDAETLACYPFPFTLDVIYTLDGDTIVKTHAITNKGETAMPFELGGHEAYAICLEPGETAADWFVQFDGGDRLEAFDMDAEGMLQLPKRVIDLQNGKLTKYPEQVGLDTIVLEDIPGSTATLACTKSSHSVTVDFPDFPYLGIWTMQDGQDPRYLCIEPWSALPDGHFMSRELSEKPGVVSVAPGETITLTYRMTFA